MSGADGGALPRDLADLVAEVLAQVPRLLALQDRDPDSPMRGCLHPAYWRDKSSDVADMRRQEAALAFALVWRHDFPGNRWQGDREILHASLRALGFWTRGQHADGTFDEWYRNEHGYATTAFSSYAVALAIEALGEELRPPLRDAVLDALRRAAGWLATHDDWFKTNHQAVGVAALGAAGRVLGDEAFLAAARRNAGRIVERMHSEGWSREISGLDLGYTFLLAEYLAMHAALTGETRFLPAVGAAFRFAEGFLHPDLTTGAEYGICGNPYFSRVAAVALAPHEPAAAAVLRWMDRPAGRPRDSAATLKDDLRLARYAYQPLLAALLAEGRFARRDLAPAAAAAAAPGGAGGSPAAPPPAFFELERAERWFPAAKLLAVARPGYVAWAAACHGGFVRVAFRDGDGFHPAVAHRGWMFDAPDGGRCRNARYALDAAAAFEDGALRVSAPLARTGFVMPPYWARVGLRVATSLPMGHRWSRWLIDQWRRRKGTALNQSAAGISRGRAPLMLERSIRFLDRHLEIEDRLVPSGEPVPPERLALVLDGDIRAAGGLVPDEDRRIPWTALAAATSGSPLSILRQSLSWRDGAAHLDLGP